MTVGDAVSSKVLKQVEFYFGDANLPRDKFLLERVQENEGVPVDTIATFARMKQLSGDIEVVKEALTQESSVIELSEDKTLVRRKQPLPDSHETLTRTVYVKGFPPTVTLDDLQEFFALHSSLVQAIRFRRHPKTKDFKGSVFVEFPSAEEASRIAALHLVFQNAPLTIKSKIAYFEEKNAEKVSKKSGSKQAVLLEKMGRGRLVKIPDFSPEGLTHEALKTALKDSYPVAYVDFNYEPGCAWIRFREAVAETFLQEYAEKPLEIDGHKLEKFAPVSEEDQGKYYEVSLKPRKFDGKKRTERKRSAPAEGAAADSTPKKTKDAESSADETVDQSVSQPADQ